MRSNTQKCVYAGSDNASSDETAFSLIHSEQLQPPASRRYQCLFLATLLTKSRIRLISTQEPMQYGRDAGLFHILLSIPGRTVLWPPLSKGRLLCRLSRTTVATTIMSFLINSLITVTWLYHALPAGYCSLQAPAAPAAPAQITSDNGFTVLKTSV